MELAQLVLRFFEAPALPRHDRIPVLWIGPDIAIPDQLDYLAKAVSELLSFQMQQVLKKERISIRSSKNRWFAFPPLNRGKKWRTLDDVDVVMLAAVDDRDDPRHAEVYRFDAKEVRKHFDAAYAARASAGHTIKDGFGMWINLDDDRRRTPVSVGAGLAAAHKPIAVFAIDKLLQSTVNIDADDEEAETETGTTGPQTIGAVIDWARQSIAALSGVPPESVKLDLKIEY